MTNYKTIMAGGCVVFNWPFYQYFGSSLKVILQGSVGMKSNEKAKMFLCGWMGEWVV